MIANTIGSILPIAVTILTIPAYLREIGAENYGVLSIVWIVFGYFGVLDFGVARAVTSVVSRERGNFSKKLEIVWSAVVLNLVLGGVLAGIGAAIFMMCINLTGNSVLVRLSPALPGMVLGIPVLMASATLNGALDGEERFKLANGIQVLGSVMIQVFPLFAAIYFGNVLFILVYAVLLARLILLFGYAWAFLVKSKGYKYIRVSIRTMRQLLKFGFSVALINIIDPLFSRVDQILIAKMVGTAEVAAYNIAANSVGRLSIIPRAMSRSLYPSLALGSIEDHRSNLFRVKDRVLPLWFGVTAIAIIACDPAFIIWLHDDIALTVSDIAKVFLVGLWANHLSALPYTALQASGKSNLIIKAHLWELPLYITGLLSLTYFFGAPGAAAAFAIRNFVDHMILWTFCGYKTNRQLKFTVMFLLLSFLALYLLQYRSFAFIGFAFNRLFS